MRRVVLATGNMHKLREIGEMLGSSGIELVAQTALGITAADETGQSFIDNALLKARHAAAHARLPAIAEDSGIEVAALDARPGIYSARYAGVQASDEENLKKLVEQLALVPDERRGARYVCAMVYVQSASDPSPIVCEGHWSGRIARERRGSNGFGYDPVFFVPELGATAAQLDSALKNAMSHRGQALRALLAALLAAQH